MLLQLHVTDDVRPKRPGRVRENRTAEARIKFFRDRGAAGLRPTLQHQRFVSRFGEIKRGDQPVVTSANDDDIARVGIG